MKRAIQQAGFLILFSLITMVMKAQVFPVQVTPQLLPPNSLQVSEYYGNDSTNAKLNLLLLLRDINRTSIRVRLRMTIESQTVRIKSREDVNYDPFAFDLQTGVPRYILPAELAQYFNANNLEFSGITQQDYVNSGKLPEGFYTFCFEAVDMVTGQTVSNRGCAFAWMALSEPPFLVLPQKAESVAPNTPQSLLFQWTPRQGANPNAYNNVEYKLTIVDITQQTGMSPEAAFFTGAVLLDSTVQSTTKVLGVAEPQLEPGHKYAWRVQVKTRTGGQPVQFRNDGYSEIFWFNYQNTCPVPQAINDSVQGYRAIIDWQANPEHLKYKVIYREKNNANAEWFPLLTTNTHLAIGDLKPNTDYEYRVGGACIVDNFTFSATYTFRTKDSTFTNIPVCGVVPDTLVNVGIPLKPDVVPGDTIYAGDFKVIATAPLTKNTDTTYTGQGYVSVSYLANMKLAVVFNQIRVGVNNKLIGGKIETTYDPTEGGILDVDSYIALLTGGIIGQQFDFPLTTSNISVSMPSGAVVITSPSGQHFTFEGGINYTFTGSNGQVFTVDQNGVLSGPFIQAPGGEVTTLNTDGVNSKGEATSYTATGIKVGFEKLPETKYVFDEISGNASAAIQEKYEKIDSDYKTYKAVENQKEDKLLARITFENGSPASLADSLIFKTKQGILINAVKQNNDYLLTVKGAFNYAQEEVLAVIRQNGKWKVAGAFKLVHISPRTVDIVLVPLNNAQIPATATTNLINTYKTAAITLNITQGESLQSGLQQIQVGGNHFFENYTEDQEDINQRIKSRVTYKNNAYYIIYSDVVASNQQIDGFMALNGQFGYIFPAATDKTVLHEVGHGVFSLEHPQRNQTSDLGSGWLMDYGAFTGVNSNGSLISHLDLKQINHPAFKLYIFQSQKSGLFTQAHLTPDWKAFKYGGSNSYYDDESLPNNPNGAVYGIVVKKRNGNVTTEKIYKWDPATHSYLANGISTPLAISLINTPTDLEPIQLFWYRNGCGFNETYNTTWGYVKNKIGFNVDDVIDGGITFGKVIPCLGAVGNPAGGGLCDGKSLQTINQERQQVEDLILNGSLNDLVEKVRQVEQCALTRLSYTNQKAIINRILTETSGEILDPAEEAVIKIMTSVFPNNNNDLYSYLAASGFTKLNRMINDFNGEEYRSLLEIVGKILAVSNKSDLEKWAYINNLIKERYSSWDDENSNEVRYCIPVFASISLYNSFIDRIPSIASTFGEMLIDDCKNLTDFQIVFEIAGKRNKDRMIFANFTQSERSASFGNAIYNAVQTGDLSWVKPKRIEFKYRQPNSPTADPSGYVHEIIEEYDLHRIFRWCKYLKDNPSVKELFSTNLSSYLNTFNTQYDLFLNEKVNANQQFWQLFQTSSCDNMLDVVRHLDANESVSSLRNIPKEKRLAVLQNMFYCPDYGMGSRVENGEDILLKLVNSFEPEDTSVLGVIERIGIKNIYDKLSGGRLSKFLFWIGGQVFNSGKYKALQPNEVSSVLNFTGSNGNVIAELNTDKILNLESDLFQTSNFSATIDDQNNIQTDLGTYAYNQMVLVYVAGSFNFIDQQFKKGSVIALPLIQAFAMSNSNRNIVNEKAAWFAVDVISFTVGIGEINVFFKAGNILRKLLVFSDLLGTTAGSIANALNEDAISPELRAKLQVFSIVAATPILATVIVPKIGKWVSSADHALNQLRGLPTFVNKNLVIDYFTKVVEKLKKVRNIASTTNKVFTVEELNALTRTELPAFVSANLDDLLADLNRINIWALTDEASGQFKRGDLIEEIFNQWGSKYGGYQNLNEIIANYPTLDFDGVLNNINEVVSLKTYHPKSATPKTLDLIRGKLKTYAGRLSTAVLDPVHAGKSRVLDFTIKRDEWSEFMDDIFDYVEELKTTYPNVTIRITEF